MSKEPKILDLDALAPEPRKIILGGEDHIEEIVSLGDYMQIVREAQELADQNKDLDERSDEEKTMKFFAHAITLINRSFPSIKEDQVKNLSIDQVGQLVTFCVNAPEDEDTADGGKKDKAAK